MSRLDLEQLKKEAGAYGKFHITFTCSDAEIEMKDRFTKFSAGYVLALIARVEKLEGALKDIVSHEGGPFSGAGELKYHLKEIAREALAEDFQTTNKGENK